MKIIMIYDQIQAGAGTKDDKMVPMAASKETIGPAVMMEPFLKQIDAKVMACLYCGTGTYNANPSEVSRKFCAMIKKLNPDLVICGPCFNYIDYAKMAATIACDIKATTGIPAISAMSVENEETIQAFKDKVNIVKMPKKGGTGLNDALRSMCQLAKVLADNGDVDAVTKEVCY